MLRNGKMTTLHTEVTIVDNCQSETRGKNKKCQGCEDIKRACEKGSGEGDEEQAIMKHSNKEHLKLLRSQWKMIRDKCST